MGVGGGEKRMGEERALRWAGEMGEKNEWVGQRLEVLTSFLLGSFLATTCIKPGYFQLLLVKRDHKLSQRALIRAKDNVIRNDSCQRRTFLLLVPSQVNSPGPMTTQRYPKA